MNKNVLIAFGGAALIAVLVAALMSAMLKGGKKEESDAAPRVQIMVAAQDIGVGEVLTETNVKWKSWPQDAALPGTIQRKGNNEKLADAAKGRTIRAIAMDEPVLRSAMVSEEGGFLAAQLAPGMRAVSIKTIPSTMVGGFINPGDFVDVVLTYKIDIRYAGGGGNRFSNNGGDGTLAADVNRMIALNLDERAADTILENVKVLGIDQSAVVDKNAPAKLAKTVTLEVDQRGAEIIALATKMGDITLVLRPLGDNQIVVDDSPTVSDARLARINRELFGKIYSLEEYSGVQRGNVRIYNGGNVTNMPVR
ncbi:MAG: Flp pilus assembly protein CpaB [Micavibrio aeruginosavorus]|nr:Flp pilus assembly protein CpaB [Micavibrio aeruginosavorus]